MRKRPGLIPPTAVYLPQIWLTDKQDKKLHRYRYFAHEVRLSKPVNLRKLLMIIQLQVYSELWGGFIPLETIDVKPSQVRDSYIVLARIPDDIQLKKAKQTK